MCGYAGILADPNASQLVESSTLVDTMCRAMIARGPDAEGRWQNESRGVVIGHQRLSIVDLDARSNQPFVSACKKYVIAYNGEIYNYKELRTSLTDSGYVMETESDTEVLLNLFIRDGKAMLPKLRGMFSFAIWSSEHNEFFLARDPYGIKPLFIVRVREGWIFASQLKALIASGKVEFAENETAVASFWMLGSVAGPQSWIDGVQELPPGTWAKLSLSSKRFRPVSYWDIGQSWLSHQVKSSRLDLQNEVRQALIESVSYHLVSDVPVGLFLSGGIDSGVLAGLVVECGMTNLNGFTICYEEFEGTQENEVPDAAVIAKHYGIKHVVRKVSKNEFYRDLPSIFEAMDQPTIDGINTWYAAKAAAEHGIKVVISGIGGDELFFGYRSFQQLPKITNFFRLCNRVPGLTSLLRFFFRFQSRRTENLRWKYACDWCLSISGAWWMRRSNCAPDEVPLEQETGRILNRALNMKPSDWIKDTVGELPENEILALGKIESMMYLRNQLLRDSDWASMAHGVELRMPLVDAHLLKRLSPHLQSMSKVRGKSLLSNAPLKPLPINIQNRKKTGFSIPVNLWLDSNIASGRLARSQLILDSIFTQTR